MKPTLILLKRELLMNNENKNGEFEIEYVWEGF